MPRTRRLHSRPDPRSPARYGASAIDTSGLAPLKPFRGGSAGAAKHAFIQSLLVAGYRHAAASEIFFEACRYPWVLKQEGPQRQQMARRHLINPAAIYFGRHRPKLHWALSGVEVRGQGARFDAVWRLPDGGWLSDEWKTGRVTLFVLADPAAQVQRELDAGAALWGPSFVGLRWCILSAPWASVDITADGRVLAIGSLG